MKKVLVLIMVLLIMIPNVNAECVDYELDIEGDYLVSNIVWYVDNSHTGWGYTDGYLVYDINYSSGLQEVKVKYYGGDDSKTWEITEEGIYHAAIFVIPGIEHRVEMYLEGELVNSVPIPHQSVNSLNKVSIGNAVDSTYLNIQVCSELPVYNQTEKCIQNWSCTNFTECTNETQERVCIDLNECNNNTGKPKEIQNCTVENETEICIVNWNCSNWTECINETQTRICSDLNECNNETLKPFEIQNCTNETNEIINKTCIINWSCSNWTNCINLTQTRICEDLNNCINETGKPIEFQNCTNETINETIPEICISDWKCNNWGRCINRKKTRECIDLNSCEIQTNIPKVLESCVSNSGGSGGSGGGAYIPKPIINKTENITEKIIVNNVIKIEEPENETEIILEQNVIEPEIKEPETIKHEIVKPEIKEPEITKTWLDKIKEFLIKIWRWLI